MPTTRPIQQPAPGRHRLHFCGDTLAFALVMPRRARGSAWIRTNIGRARVSRQEIIRHVRRDDPLLGRDWFDIPMKPIDDHRFRVELPLCEVGHFAAKCYFLESGSSTPLWPDGPNTIINVEPADTCCANGIYNAFVRQFGPNKSGQSTGQSVETAVRELDSGGYTVIPPSGKFRDLIRQLDFITGTLGCRYLQLLPIHPTPTTYGRMGRFGSPYAALSFTDVDPALAEFDPKATPLEQFIELADAVHRRGAKLILDIAINHTGWAASLHESHPRWLARDADGAIEVPGAWGVRWEDLTRLDYSHTDLWHYMAEVFQTWCRRGVDGFRCDAGYMIPIPAWRFIVASVREQYPNTIFLLEGLGGPMPVTRRLLNTANLNWAYSELFQNYDRGQIESYLPEPNAISAGEGIMVHWAETHDNPRLAGRSIDYARMRTMLSALFSSYGAFGFANGVEWHAEEKINVHNASSLNWGAEPNQVGLIRRLNILLASHPAFFDRVRLTLVQEGDDNCVVLQREHVPSGKNLLVLVNLDDRHRSRASWRPNRSGLAGPIFVDLISEDRITVSESADRQAFDLAPGQVLCLSDDSEDLTRLGKALKKPVFPPARLIRQRLRAKALEVFTACNGTGDMGNFSVDDAAGRLAMDPEAFCRKMNTASSESRVVNWFWPRDIRREVMVPPDHFILIQAHHPFRVRLVNRDRALAVEDSLPGNDGAHFALVPPRPAGREHTPCRLLLSVFRPGKAEHAEAALLFLTRARCATTKATYHRRELTREKLLMLGTNGRGGMLRSAIHWGELSSRYDALLAANLNPTCPEDRWIMLTRCRAWLVFQGYSQKIGRECLDGFRLLGGGRGFWRYRIPTGQGEHVRLTVGLEMIDGHNALRLIIYRHPADGQPGHMKDESVAQLIIRPDIEDRNFHETTKAYIGPEAHFAAAVARQPEGFVFTPSPERQLTMQAARGDWVSEPEWHYMIHRPLEAERGLDPDSDLFSPGYFTTRLKGGEWEEFTARAGRPENAEAIAAGGLMAEIRRDDLFRDHRVPLGQALEEALEPFIVNRGAFKSIIAGYPWFLDWGRDSLIVVRGLIAAGKIKEARAILQQFGRFEAEGTLPNMIRGTDAANRDTSDAPLWFITACAELIDAENSPVFLSALCGDRTIRDVILSIGRGYAAGTPNGIRMDPESGLIYSPAHFTWMDTNHPAGTPRAGYPVEIQALWFRAADFLARLDRENADTWRGLAERVQVSLAELFYQPDLGCLADCLHANSGEPAQLARPDDALRPNQLFAVTLGALTDKHLCRQTVDACRELLVPGAIRSLADRPVQRPLEIRRNGELLVDPHNPYQGVYAGDEDSRRKPAYHNGTAWTWVFPSFCEAWAAAYGSEARQTALDWLASATRLLNAGCIGQVPEILDGNAPHRQRGCDAQAWGASELLRVWLRLHGPGS